MNMPVEEFFKRSIIVGYAKNLVAYFSATLY